MNIEELYHFLFETMPGIGILVGGGLLDRKEHTSELQSPS